MAEVVVVDVDWTVAGLAAPVVESLADVGRTGATAEAVLDEVGPGNGGQDGEPQARSVGQQPPPRVAGQDW